MKTRITILVVAAVAVIVVAIVAAPRPALSRLVPARPALSQESPQPVSISIHGDGESLYVLYDNDEVWRFGLSSNPVDVGYPM